MSSSTTRPPGDEPTLPEQAPIVPGFDPGPVAAEQTPEQVVASPAVEGDLNADMRRAATAFAKPTLILAGVLVLALAFAGGAWTHAAFGSTSSASGRGGATTGQRAGAGTGQTAASGQNGSGQNGSGQNGSGQNGTGQRGQGGGGFRGGRGTVGTIDHVDGTTVYVKTAQGDVVPVSTTDSTTIGLTQPGKLADLKRGASVTVQGQTGSDGSVAAQAITQQPPR